MLASGEISTTMKIAAGAAGAPGAMLAAMVAATLAASLSNILEHANLHLPTCLPDSNLLVIVVEVREVPSEAKSFGKKMQWGGNGQRKTTCPP